MQLATLPGGRATPEWCHGRFGLSHIFRKFHQRNPKSSDPVGSNFTSSMGGGDENDTIDFRPVPKNKQTLNKFLRLRIDRNLFRWFGEITVPEHQIRVGYHETRNQSAHAVADYYNFLVARVRFVYPVE